MLLNNYIVLCCAELIPFTVIISLSLSLSLGSLISSQLLEVLSRKQVLHSCITWCLINNTFKPSRPEMEEQTIVGIPNQTHEPAPVEGTSDDANRRRRFESTLKQTLCTLTFLEEWSQAEEIFCRFPEMVRIPLTGGGDTALHVAVMENSSTFVKGLVSLEHMTREDLEIRNADRNTAFCMAAMTGNGEFVQIMIEKNENLPVIRGQDGMLPVHLAALFGNHKITQDLTSENLLHNMDFEDIERLFLMTINSCMYDVAMKLLEKYPEELVVARNDREETAFHILARQPSEEIYMRESNSNETSSGRDQRLRLLHKLCYQASQLECHEILELITHPSVVLFDAVKSGNFEVVKLWLLSGIRGSLMTIRDSDTGRNLLHFAVLYRRRRIFYFILRMGTRKRIMRAVDKNGNNVLHLAAHRLEETSSSSRPNIQMQRELTWFKEVEKIVPPELWTMRNSDGKTPIDLFYAMHRKLSNEVKEEAKGIANSSMVVAALIATVAFAAALIVPGDKNSGWFIVFMLTNAVALFTSSASIISFLSIFTSPRFTESELIFSIHPSLLLGLTLLFISIVSMVIAFAAASFLTFDHIDKWVAYVVASLGLLPILTFLVLQSSLFDALRDCLPPALERPLAYLCSTIYLKAKRMFQLASRINCPKREGTANTS